MMNPKKLRERQATMRARPRKARPWEHKQDIEADQFIVRLRMLFAAGYGDEFIANAFSLDVELVQILRTAKSRRPHLRPVAL
jgi:hypothetical protein